MTTGTSDCCGTCVRRCRCGAATVREGIQRASGERAWRFAARIARRLGTGGDADDTLASVGVMARAGTELEKLLGDATGDAGPVSAFAYIERFANLRAMAAGRGMRLRTSIDDVLLDRDLARCVALAVCELVEVVELSQVSPPDLMLALDERDGGVVVALAAVGGHLHPVPSGDGAAALKRAERLVEAAGGGLVRGVRDDMMLAGLVLPVNLSRPGPRR